MYHIYILWFMQYCWDHIISHPSCYTIHVIACLHWYDVIPIYDVLSLVVSTTHNSGYIAEDNWCITSCTLYLVLVGIIEYRPSCLAFLEVIAETCHIHLNHFHDMWEILCVRSPVSVKNIINFSSRKPKHAYFTTRAGYKVCIEKRKITEITSFQLTNSTQIVFQFRYKQ